MAIVRVQLSAVKDIRSLLVNNKEIKTTYTSARTEDMQISSAIRNSYCLAQNGEECKDPSLNRG
jgi:hypothetical protein